MPTIYNDLTAFYRENYEAEEPRNTWEYLTRFQIDLYYIYSLKWKTANINMANLTS